MAGQEQHSSKTLLVQEEVTNNIGAVSLLGSTQTDAGALYIPGLQYNGETYDRQRNNAEGTLFASGPRISTTTTPYLKNYNGRGIFLYLNVTANPGGAETLTLLLQSVDPVSGVIVTLANSGVMFTATNGCMGLMLYPGAVETIAATQIIVQGVILPRNWRAVVTHSGIGEWTYSLGYSLIM